MGGAVYSAETSGVCGASGGDAAGQRLSVFHTYAGRRGTGAADQAGRGAGRAGGVIPVLWLHGAGAGTGRDGAVPYPPFYQQSSGRLGGRGE